MTGLCRPRPCTQWKLPGYRNPKAEPDHLHYICDTGEMHFPRNRLLPYPWRIVFTCSTTWQSKANQQTEGEPPPLHPHPHSRLVSMLSLSYHKLRLVSAI